MHLVCEKCFWKHAWILGFIYCVASVHKLLKRTFHSTLIPILHNYTLYTFFLLYNYSSAAYSCLFNCRSLTLSWSFSDWVDTIFYHHFEHIVAAWLFYNVCVCFIYQTVALFLNYKIVNQNCNNKYTFQDTSAHIQVCV